MLRRIADRFSTADWEWLAEQVEFVRVCELRPMLPQLIEDTAQKLLASRPKPKKPEIHRQLATVPASLPEPKRFSVSVPVSVLEAVNG